MQCGCNNCYNKADRVINNVVGLVVLEVVVDKVTLIKFILSLLEILSSFEKGVKMSKGVKAHLAREVLVVAAALAVLELAPKIRA